MAKNNIRNIIKNCASHRLDGSVKLFGTTEFTLSTNLVCWDGDKMYTMDEISPSFGISQTVTNLISSEEETRFQCGKSNVALFDFGLLCTAFSCIHMAATELGTSVPVEENHASNSYHIAWFGNDGIIYSLVHNVIIIIHNKDTYKLCTDKVVSVKGFTHNDIYKLELENLSIIMSSSNGSIICKFKVPVYVTQVYRNIFENTLIVDDPNTPWDETSQLGSIIADTNNSVSIKEALDIYKERSSLAQVVIRNDLILHPTRRYNNLSKFLGSWAYSDDKEIIMPINEHEGLLVYTTSKSLTRRNSNIILNSKVNPNYEKFFDITEEFNHILRFAYCQSVMPLTAAELDTNAYMQIKDAFMNLTLSRIKLNSSFGRIVIPESVMLNELSSSTGDALYCILPVGVIGDQLISLNSSGVIITEDIDEKFIDGYFYDVTDMITSIRKHLK